MLMILHFVSIIIPIVSLLIKDSSVRYLLYWLFNILAPNINAQVIITYIMARNSVFCKVFNEAFSTGESDLTFFKSIGDETMGVNAAILVLHVVVLLLFLILIDTGFLQFSFTCCYTPHFNENKLDDDVRTERHRVLSGRDNNGDSADPLIVNDLVKYYPMRKVLAVDHLAFGAKRGEVFGLLGFNVSRPVLESNERHRDLLSVGRWQDNDLSYCRGRYGIDERHGVHRRKKRSASSEKSTQSGILSTGELQHGLSDGSGWPLPCGENAGCQRVSYRIAGGRHELVVSLGSLLEQLHPSVEWRNETTFARRSCIDR